ncbi:MAG TPA: hypothetical protein VK840_05810, partial [Candidatus Dormibacteraeota bacterium]|nr:hypothetical protein [Candidatus Dormibacteraeota bacterium]
ILCLALVLSGGLLGCASAKFKVMPDKLQLTDNHRIVAEVTCVEAKPTEYTTFRDEYLRVGAMPPHVRWTVKFHVDRILKGTLAEQTFTIVDCRIAGNPYFRFWFEAGKIYTVGFNSESDNQVNDFAVLGHAMIP